MVWQFVFHSTRLSFEEHPLIISRNLLLIAQIGRLLNHCRLLAWVVSSILPMPASRDLEEESQKNIYSKRNLKRRGIIRLASRRARGRASAGRKSRVPICSGKIWARLLRWEGKMAASKRRKDQSNPPAEWVSLGDSSGWEWSFHYQNTIDLLLSKSLFWELWKKSIDVNEMSGSILMLYSKRLTLMPSINFWY